MAIGRCRTVIARCGLSVRHGMSLVIALSRQAPRDRRRSFGLGMSTNLSLDAVQILPGMKAEEVNNIRPSGGNDERSVLVEALPEITVRRAGLSYGLVSTWQGPHIRSDKTPHGRGAAELPLGLLRRPIRTSYRSSLHNPQSLPALRGPSTSCRDISHFKG